ncbi:MAG: hypothetical protein M1820_000046 [Bogoriella megaspora]|nr:MAG: hypothetical protein M1820_000046 [Bogoriella megaspora]
MKAAQFIGTAGGLEKNLQFNSTASPPAATLKPGELTVEVISAALNPVDHKIPELPIVGRFVPSRPASPGMDYCGKVVATGSKASADFKSGQFVFGKLDNVTKFGTLGQFITAQRVGAALLPNGVNPDQAAAIGVAGLTAYQCLIPNCKRGDRIFIHGGSGGTGTFGIQYAKIQGCHVTTTCSSDGVQLCKDLGADEVIDYKTTDVIGTLKAKGPGYFSLVVDNVGTPSNLYKASDDFLDGKYVQIGGESTFTTTYELLSRMFWPTILGGGKAPFQFLSLKADSEQLAQTAQWIKEGKMKAMIDSTYELEEAAKAYQKLKFGKPRGKVVVHVTEP